MNAAVVVVALSLLLLVVAVVAALAIRSGLVDMSRQILPF